MANDNRAGTVDEAYAALVDIRERLKAAYSALTGDGTQAMKGHIAGLIGTCVPESMAPAEAKPVTPAPAPDPPTVQKP